MLVISLIVNNSAAQQRQIYLQSYNYIKTHNGSCSIFVVDTIVNIDIAPFSGLLSKEWMKNSSHTMEIIDSLDNIKISHKKYQFLNRFNTNNKSTKIIYFSNFRGGLLVADVFDEKLISNLNYHKQTQYNQSERYLFIFNKRNKIRKVFRLKMQYN